MRTPRALPVYPWGDNEKLEFGDGADYAIYFDGTDFLIDSGTHSLEIDLATAGKTTIYGGDTAGDDLHLYANSVNPKSRIDLLGAGDIEIVSDNDLALVPDVDIDIYGSGIMIFKGSGCQLQSTTDDDIFLNPHGTGYVKFGTVVGTGDVVSDGHILIKDAAGNAVKLMKTA